MLSIYNSAHLSFFIMIFHSLYYYTHIMLYCFMYVIKIIIIIMCMSEYDNVGPIEHKIIVFT